MKFIWLNKQNIKDLNIFKEMKITTHYLLKKKYQHS